MKKLFLIAVLGLVQCLSFAQGTKGSVKGFLQDSVSGTPLVDATVSVTRVKDSSLVSFALTGNGGSFEIRNLEEGEYQLIASFSGLQTKKTRFSITADKSTADLGLVQLHRIYKSMEGVTIVDDAPVKIKGDTLAFNADAFKTKPNASVEDLLKKMPGMQVDKDGTVKAQGEEVQKVYVDGKEFFGNDPKLATKNLTADMVDQVEVFDDMSEQAKFNKIDDGSRTKAINLKLKKDKKKGIFGRAYAGYGTKERYDAGVNANFFKGATQTSIIAKTNNVSNIGFSVNDQIGMFSTGAGGGRTMGGGGNIVMGGGGRMMGSPGFSGGLGGLNMGTTGSGITSSSQIGINYRDTWSKHFDVTGSYFYNEAKTDNLRKSYKQTLFADSTVLTDEEVLSRISNSNHRFNLNMVYSIDSFNSIIYSPNFSYQKSQSFADDTLMSAIQKASQSYRANESRNITNSLGDGYSWNNNLIWRRKFRRAGRTLSVNFSNTWSANDRERYSSIHSRFFNMGGAKYGEDIVNNVNVTDSRNNSYTLALSYTEPISRDKIMEVNYSRSNNSSSSDRKTLDYNNATGKYDQVVDTLSNHFNNRNMYDRAGANFRVVKKKYNYQLGFAVQQTTLNSDNLTKKTNVRQKFTNFFPSASFNYQFQRSRNLRINYRGRTQQPSINQLQDVTDVTGYPNIYRGNPNLKQEFTNNVILSYNFFDVVKYRNMFAFFSFSNTLNKISNSREDLGGGVQRTTPVNIDGTYNLSGNVNLGFPIKKLKGGNFNTTTRINYNRDANLVNGFRNYTRNLNIGEELRQNYNHKDRLDLGITASINFNSVRYTLQPKNNARYFTHTYSADATYSFPMGFILSTDFDYTFNTGRTNGFNRNYALWNASFAKELFKSKRGELKVSVFDILNQNTNVTRNIVDNYIEDVENTTLQRFFMFTFSYKLNRMGGKAMPAMQRGNFRISQ